MMNKKNTSIEDAWAHLIYVLPLFNRRLLCVPIVLRSHITIISLVINSKVTQFKQKICIKLTSSCQSLV